MPIITWSDVVKRYADVVKFSDATDADANQVAHAINELESRLGTKYTVPFSDNNVTAKDLSIDISYLKFIRFKDPKKAEQIDEYINSRIEDLLNGDAIMVTTSGDNLASVGGTVYSTTLNYHPVFGMSRVELLEVDSAQIIDEEATRGRFG